MVFYRKYRPQTIEELDSKDVRDKLYAVLSAKDIAHAFLFTGPKGLGKTSAARIVAKSLNCIDQKSDVRSRKSDTKSKQKSEIRHLESDIRTIEPCNKCSQCISITKGTNLDVLEIDGASNRGIDEIRDLREKVRLSPAAAFKKVYIIDEVHMLTQEAFNALLKTLEEPPSHVIFILCTTEPHKVPGTIVSRCFHILFKKASIEELVRSFQRIAEKEKLTIDSEALNVIASLSDGSFRDGVKILEEIAIMSDGKKISKEIVERKYQIRQLTDQVSQMIEFLSRKNTSEALQLTSKLFLQGVDMKYFLEQLINALHSFMLNKVGVKSNEEFLKTSYEFSIAEIKDLVELLAKAYADLKYAVLPQLPLEMVIVEWGMEKSVLRSLRQFENSSNASVPASRYLTPSEAGSSEEFSHAKAPRTLKEDEIWQVLINKVKLHNHSIAGVLRGCTLKEYDNKKLIIETGYKFHKERLEDVHAQEIIRKVCKEIAGKTIEISIEMKAG